MKKILYTMLVLFFMNIAMADIDFTQAIQNTTMPTDAEIRAVLKQFEFTQEQEDAVFKEVKGKLKAMYTAQDKSKYNMELNQYYNQIDSEAVGVFTDGSLKQELRQGVARIPQGR